MLGEFQKQIQQPGNAKLAEYLHLELAELNLLDWEVKVEKDPMGVITNYAIKFHDNSNEAVLHKITGLSDENEVDIDLNFFQQIRKEVM